MGNSANTMYATRKIERAWKPGLFMAGLPVLRAHALHPVVEDEAQQQDDEEIDQRERRRRTQVELADGLLREVLREEGGGVARATAGEHERLGVDHEAVHEPQQH